jgi:polyisoprenoid-binding protein YceI
MSRPLRILITLFLVGLVVGVGAFLVFIYIPAGSSTPSVTISAPTLAPESTANAAASGTAETGTSVTFDIVPEESEVRFTIDELLNSNPNKVIGRTNQVAGQIRVNFDRPAEAEVGEIRVNVRSMVTDNEMRTRTIRRAILQSDQEQFEFAQFVPTSIDGLPDVVTIGQPFNFQITGDLTVRDITKPVTFDVTVHPNSETRIDGLATATIQRADYNLTIPSVPNVADVAEEVGLEIDFVATASQG